MTYKYQVHLILSTGERFSLDLRPSFTQDIVQRWFKHLRHVDIPWRSWEYLPWASAQSETTIVDTLSSLASRIGTPVQAHQLSEQQYLNFLHQQYEKGYDGRQEWTDFHELIHIIENRLKNIKPYPVLEINYRHLAGPLKIKFQHDWLEHGTNTVTRGTVYLAWDELGKTPYRYFVDQEPDDVSRFLELTKPWVWLRPKLHVALDDIDFSVQPIDGWYEWYHASSRHDLFCDRYQIPHWSLEDMYKVLPIGTIPNIDQLVDNIINGSSPCRVTIDNSTVLS